MTLTERKAAVADKLLDSRERFGPRQWGMVLLRHKSHMSVAEIARIFHCEERQVSAMLRHAIRRALA